MSRVRDIAAFLGLTEANNTTNAVLTSTEDPAGLDSAGVTNIIDSAYVQIRADSAYLENIIDSAYVSARSGGGGGGALSIDADDNMISSNSTASPTAGSGLRNIIVGTGAGTSITTSDDNIAIGTNSGTNITTGERNTLIGHMNLTSLSTLVTGSRNTTLGYDAGRSITGDDNTIVGAAVLSDGGSRNTTIGAGSQHQFDGWHNVTMGYSSTSQGTRTYGGAFVTGASAGYCVTMGYGCLTSGQNSIAIGKQAATSGGEQIAIGHYAGVGNPVNTSKGSISIGYYAGADNEADNTINIGYNAGKNFSSSANYNVNIGYEAASYTAYNPNSQYCVNIGYRAGIYARGSYNVAIGNLTGGASNISASGSNNVSIGRNAGRLLSSGYENVFIGANSDQVVTTGNANVLIGATTNVNSSAAVAQVVLGYGLNGQGNNTFRVRASSGSYNTQNSSTWTTTSDERIKTNITDYTTGLTILDQVNVKTYNYLSDSDIATAHPELTDSDGLVHEQLDTTKTVVGLMAQDLETLLPNSVITRDNGIKSVNKDELFWVMLNSIKELSTKYNNLDSDHNSLITRLEALENA